MSPKYESTSQFQFKPKISINSAQDAHYSKFASAPSHYQSRWEDTLQFLKMYKLSVALVCVGLVACGPVPDAEAGHQGYSSGPKCHQNVQKQCHQKPINKERQECHEEYDVVIDTVYHEQCEDVVTRHCQYSHTQVLKLMDC